MNLKIAVIVGSNRPIRAGRKVADWFMGQIANTPGVQFDLIDMVEVNLPFLNEPKSPIVGQYEHEHTKQWSTTIQQYDGYIWVTSEYNHGYPAALKNAVDSLFHEWAHKPVAFVGYGGLGGARAIEQLVSVAARVNLAPITVHTVNIVNIWSAFAEDGALKPEHVHGDIAKTIEELRWWAEALKTARTASGGKK